MFELKENSPDCRFIECPYILKGHCGINIKSESSIISTKCIPTDNWYVTGSFVLDSIFGVVTAHDIDLVAAEGEMPNNLPSVILQSPLKMETLWVTPKLEAMFTCHNINLPRLTSQGLINKDIADNMLKDRLIKILPNKKKLTMLTICSAIKPIVKYKMEPDERTFGVWSRSIMNPPGLKKTFAFMFDNLPIESVDWDYLRAELLIHYLNLAYKESQPIFRLLYLAKLREILLLMGHKGDLAYDNVIFWLDAVIVGDEQKQNAIEKHINSQAVKLRGR